MRDRIVILMAAVMFAAGLIMTNPVGHSRKGNAWEATPVLAQQYYGGPDNSTPYQQMPSQLDIHPSAYGGWNCSFGKMWGSFWHALSGGFPWHLEN